MGRGLAVAATVAILVAAAVVAVLWPRPDEPQADAIVVAGVVSHDSTGLVPSPVEFADTAVVLRPLGQPGYEPTIGVTAKGNVFVTGGSAAVWRSTDKGRSWSDMNDRAPGSRDQDPFLLVDQDYDRIFSAPNQGLCSDIRWSIDEGESWNPPPPRLPAGPTLPPVPQRGGCGYGGHDHQNLAAGPAPPGQQAQGSAYRNIVYYAYNDRTSAANASGSGTFLSRSLDGGTTWEPNSTRVFPTDCQLGLNGVPAVTRNGTLLVPKPGCNGLRIGVSYDGGRSFNVTDITDNGMGGGTQGVVTYSTNPAVAADRAGNVYALWAGDDGLLYLTRSKDGGATWSAPLNATPPGVNVTAFGALTAGAEGRIAFAYLATSANATDWTRKEAHFAPPGTPWHLHLAWSLDAHAVDPVFTTLNTTADADPVHRGRIWQAGDAGPQTPDRQLRDFIGMTQRGGRPFVSYADSCAGCTSPAASAMLWIAVADRGPSLDAGALAPYG